MCLMLGISYCKLGQYSKAIEKLKFAVEAGLRDYEPFYYMGICHIALGNTEEARSWFKKAVEKVLTNLVQDRLDAMRQACTGKPQIPEES
jgi:tetratricopeptide (TPR) repeat protein